MTGPIALSARQRRASATISWRFVLWAALLGSCWDAGAMIFTGHSSAYNGPGYYWLRQAPGGMRTFGILLGVLVVATIYAYGRSAAARSDLLLRGGLGLLVFWYLSWTGALLVGWETEHQWSGAGSLGRTLSFSVICFLAAWFSPKG